MIPLFNPLALQQLISYSMVQPNLLTMPPTVLGQNELAILLNNSSQRSFSNATQQRFFDELGKDPIKKVKTIEATIMNAAPEMGSMLGLTRSFYQNGMFPNFPSHLTSQGKTVEPMNACGSSNPSQAGQLTVTAENNLGQQSLQNIQDWVSINSKLEKNQLDQPQADIKSDTASTKTQSPLLSAKTPQIRFLDAKKLNEDKNDRNKNQNIPLMTKNPSGGRKKIKKVEEMSEEELESEESEGEEEEEGKDVFKPTKHCFYVAKKTITEKRVLPKRAKPELHKVDEDSINPLELILQLTPRIKGMLGYDEIDQDKLYLTLAKCDMDMEKTCQKIKGNLRYFKRHLKMKVKQPQ